jgi:hypothetical protein
MRIRNYAVMVNRLSKGLVAGILLAGTLAAAPVLTLNPGTRSGLPGQTVGWGFKLTNDTDFLLFSEVAFCEGPFISGGCTDTYGVFTDFLAQFQSVVLGPGDQINELFDDSTQQGIGSFKINNNAVAGNQDMGTIFVIYDAYSCDPTVCSDPVQDVFSGSISAPAEVDVQAATGTPEPATMGVVGLVLAGLIALRYLHRVRLAA